MASSEEAEEKVPHFVQDNARLPWWSLGIFFYIALFGEHPFLVGERLQFDTPLYFPQETDTHVKYFFELVLDRKIDNRLCTLAAFKSHHFFRDFDWDSLSVALLENCPSNVTPPLIPSEKHTKAWKVNVK